MSNHRILPLILIFSLVPLGPLAIDIYLPSIPQMIEVFNASNSDLQFTIAIYVFALGVCQLIAGPISDRFGRKTSALLGLGIYTAGSVLVVISLSLSSLYIARMLQGVGASFTMVTAMAWVRDNYDGEAAGKWLSYIGGMTGVIPTIAPLLGSVLALAWGWQAGFVAMAAIAMILFLLALLSLDGKIAVATKAEGIGVNRLPCNLKAIAKNSQFRAYSLANLFSFGGLLTYITTAPIVAMKEGGLSEFSFAMLFGVIGFFQVTTSFVAPRIVSYIGQRQTVRMGLSLVALGGIGLVLIPADETYAFFTFAALSCGGFSVMVGTASALNLQPFANCAGLAAAIEGFIRMVGGAVIASALGYLQLSSVDKLATAFLLSLIPLLIVQRDLVNRRKVLGVIRPY